MPELPEVETTCRGLARACLAQPIMAAQVSGKKMRRPWPPQLAKRLVGRQLVSISRRAKYILAATDDAHTLLVHLGMSGRLVQQITPPTGKHDHLVLQLGKKHWLIFNDPRRFGCVDYQPTATIENHPLLRHLGPEALEPAFTPAALQRAAASRSTSLKAFLLDQTVVAGLGNIYVCEALFGAGLDPRRAASTLTLQEAQRLVPAIRQVLRAAIKAGGSSLRDYVQADGKLGFFQDQFAVYDRAGQPCPDCDCNLAKTGGVQRLAQGGRSTFWCPQRQH